MFCCLTSMRQAYGINAPSIRKTRPEICGRQDSVENDFLEFHQMNSLSLPPPWNPESRITVRRISGESNSPPEPPCASQAMNVEAYSYKLTALPFRVFLRYVSKRARANDMIVLMPLRQYRAECSLASVGGGGRKREWYCATCNRPGLLRPPAALSRIFVRRRDQGLKSKVGLAAGVRTLNHLLMLNKFPSSSSC